MNANKIDANSKSGDRPALVADEIRALVTRGVFAPGLQLRQVDLAKRFGASRMPVREALKLLTGEGVVAHDPNRGFFVAGLSSEEARQLYRIRHLLESELLSTVAWPSKQQLAEFNVQLKHLDKLMKARDRAEWAIQHRHFYWMIFQLSPHKVLKEEVLRLLRMTDRYRSLGPHASEQDDVAPERHVVNALAARDRSQLLRVFEQDRRRIEEDLVGGLVGRGM